MREERVASSSSATASGATILLPVAVITVGILIGGPSGPTTNNTPPLTAVSAGPFARYCRIEIFPLASGAGAKHQSIQLQGLQFAAV
jgi:hypothetical protein